MRLTILSAGLLAAYLLQGCSTTRSRDAETHLPRPAPRNQSVPQIETEVFRQVNAYRRSRGLHVLTSDPLLARVARDHSRAMAARRRMSHDGFDRRFGQVRPYGFVSFGENVAMTLGHDDPASTAFVGWRRSRGHHRNMVARDSTHTGVGVARGRDGGLYFTQLFGSH